MHIPRQNRRKLTMRWLLPIAVEFDENSGRFCRLSVSRLQSGRGGIAFFTRSYFSYTISVFGIAAFKRLTPASETLVLTR